MDEKLDQIIALLRAQVAAIEALTESNRDLIRFIATEGMGEPEGETYLDGSPVHG